MASKTSNTISRAEFDALVTRTTLLEAQIALLQSAPAGKKVRKTKALAEGEEKKVRKPSPWIEHSTRVSKLLADEEHADAKAAVGKARLAFCSHLKDVCSGDYESLTDETILEQALSYVVPEGKVKKPVVEEPAEEPAPAPAPAAKKTPVKKAKAAEEAPPAPAPAPKKAPAPAPKKVAKKAAAAGSASESEGPDV
jgi:hypothetical protein